jgi:hypothetical protein
MILSILYKLGLTNFSKEEIAAIQKAIKKKKEKQVKTTKKQ